MDTSFLEQSLKWVNTPLFYIGQTPVTLGGVGSAILVFTGSFFVSAFLRRLIGNRLVERFKLPSGMDYAIKRTLHYLVVLLGLVLATQCVGLNLGSFAIIFGFLGVGIGFGFQNVTSNFISGLIILLERPISVRDFVKVEDQVGTVEQISMRSTLIRTQDNVSIVVPNSKFVENPVTNWSHGDPRIRIHCPVGVAYGSDIPKVKATLLNVATSYSGALKEPKPEVRFLEFGNSSLDFDLLVWINEPRKQFGIRSDINYAIDAAFREAAIQIPFPQRDVHLQLTPAIEKLAKA